MMSKDHRLLGEALARQMIHSKSYLKNHLFITGCVFPNHNPLTYVKGLCIGHPFKTHFYFLSYPKISRLFKKLENKRQLYFIDYYRLGILIHYVADAFTFPHNEQYPGTMLEHAAYEKYLLHKELEGYIAENLSMCLSVRYDEQPPEKAFLDMHDAYLNGKMSPEKDAVYICNCSVMVCRRVLEAENEPEVTLNCMRENVYG